MTIAPCHVAVYAILACSLAGCGQSQVMFTSADPPADSASAATPIVKAADAKAQVFNVPISKILVHAAAAPVPSDHQGTGGTAPMTMSSKTSAAAPASPDASKKAPAPDKAQDTGTTNAAPNPTGATTSVISANNKPYTITVLPQESDMVLRATPVNDFFSENQFGISKFASTDIPVSVQNKFTDLTQSRITAAGQFVSAAIPLIGFLSTARPPEVECPPGASIPDFVIIADSFNKTVNVPGSTCWQYTLVSVTSPMQDTVSREVFKSAFVNGQKVSIWPVPSCLDVVLQVVRKGGPVAPELNVPLRIIDPKYVRLVGFPEQGKIAMHPVCDADVTDSPVDKWGTAFDALTALETQAQAALKARGGSGSGGGGAPTGTPAQKPR